MPGSKNHTDTIAKHLLFIIPVHAPPPITLFLHQEMILMKVIAASRNALFALLPVLIIYSGNAQEVKKSKAARKEDAVIEKNLRTHIYLLASDSLEGRRAGTPGEQKAINYLLSQYQQIGLPATPGKKYVYDFEIDEGKLLSEDSKLLINDTPLQSGADYFPLAWSATGRLQDVSSVALQEQGAPWWYDMKEAMESNASNPHFLPEQHIRDIAKDARRKGATALLVFNSSSKPDSIAFNRKDKSPDAGIPVIYITSTGIKKTGVNATSSPAVDLSIAFIAKKRIAHNLVAWLDNGAANTVILGAHLDHLGYGEDNNSRYTGEPAIHHGADDNASGTAALLELARLIKQKTSPAAKKKNAAEYNALRQNNYVFVHFSGEELGLYGSKFYTDSPTVDLSAVNYMINMDMVGRLNDSAALTIGGVGTSPAWGELLHINGADGFKIKIDSSGTGPSDHTSFYRKNIPVLFFFTGLHADYHKPADEAGKINFEGETKIVDYIVDIIENAASKGKLAFTKTKEQTMTGSRYKVSIGIMPDYTFSGNGVRADGVIEGRPAQKAGMLAGDVITRLGDFSVSGMESYMQALNKFEKGDKTTVTVKRGNEETVFPISF